MEGLVIPEVVLYRLINGLLKEISDNWLNTSDKTKTHLYRFWNGVEDGKYKYYDEAVSLFVDRNVDNPRKVECRMFYDRERSALPTMHITMPSDQIGANELGVSESGREDEMFVDSHFGQITPTLARRFDAQFYIVCSSDNNREVLLMYHTLRAMIISAWHVFEHSCMENMKLTGQELRMQEHLVPNHIFMRGLGIMHSYDVRVPSTFPLPLITQLIINPATIVDDSSDSNNN
jgi:hypothetical protein